jgi:transcriptional regulator with GAF, ATPase, and Fis domain
VVADRAGPEPVNDRRWIGPLPSDGFVAGAGDHPDLTLDDGLRHVVELATRTVPGTAAGSVVLLRGRRAYLAATAGDLAGAIGTAECEHRDGPALDAAATEGALIHLPDLSARTRWPDWAVRARAAGAAGALAVGLPFREWVAGALTLYATTPDAFDADALILARTFAGYAAVALAHSHVRETMTALTRQVHAASDSRAVVEQARGVLMGTRGCTAAQALAIMTGLSRDSGRSLAEVAADVLAGSAGPRTPRADTPGGS